ncbi:MAG: Rhodanese-related sulfurtransferase [Solidesulfovibrio magneticus str. Maddingley MBC34]|uniref:Rhodanese-related sulfurtransferase n=1 Tax=Solidesulfovibrio magneticus str. Maddingley MBC34 TaxID=1206767 RepID=K6HD74_9BACT|nr:MAG: Rhodanese-related sulfurtransferase [Solidesulfovibrio magneticus str. Maddingley MBC34]
MFCRPAHRPFAFLALPLLAALSLLAACQEQPKTDPERQAKAYALYEGYKKDFPEAAEMRPEEALKLWRESGVVFIDARSEAERAVSTLPGAVSEHDYLADPDRFAGKQAVIYCTIGYRSGVLVQKLAAKGIAAANLASGILGWLHAGGTLVDASGVPTKRVHVYGRTWDLAPLAYTAVW